MELEYGNMLCGISGKRKYSGGLQQFSIHNETSKSVYTKGKTLILRPTDQFGVSLGLCWINVVAHLMG